MGTLSHLAALAGYVIAAFKFYRYSARSCHSHLRNFEFEYGVSIVVVINNRHLGCSRIIDKPVISRPVKQLALGGLHSRGSYGHITERRQD